MDGLAEADLLLDDARDEVLARDSSGYASPICPTTSSATSCRNGWNPETVPVPQGPAHDPPKHVPAPLVGGHHAIGKQERGRPGVVRDHPIGPRRPYLAGSTPASSRSLSRIGTKMSMS